MENLHLDIKDVHLLYEDDILGDGVTATGIMIKSPSAQTWNHKFVYRVPVLGQLDAFKLSHLLIISLH